jgi:hypothetical protein
MRKINMEVSIQLGVVEHYTVKLFDLHDPRQNAVPPSSIRTVTPEEHAEIVELLKQYSKLQFLLFTINKRGAQ